ncbi:uncharacterized protein NECHADRAFT_44642 [Fusarium vanettenii 77-13-4]|uniref:Methyltransferase domain-containing protein n=1 Tax=Fusarium vanettenii (strain ATCC MYA-4622 / CBS 123669 / FGSC 9596 / NRRL 45880 / 77-13-4) TaxID=660122 RepID=C7ZMT0_FUSV7|nr:uncharacterized protein NECHADRAFT_44642 [Fusarium vanettenii 77-13-4]EEU34689.1 hypothetical protein NECHADRAFT_44642 [Fusarium vanettenii 77-13-4]
MEAPNDVKDRLRASYNAMSSQYNTWTERHHYLRRKYLNELVAHCPELVSDSDGEKHEVLELGCGSGDPFLSTLLSQAPTVHAHANDLSDVQLDLARKNLAAYEGRATFYPGDMMKLEFAPESLTSVIALYSIIHLQQEEQKEIFRRIGNWLAPGGVFLSTFDRNKESGIIMDKWLDDKGWMFWSGLGKDETVAALQASGLNVEKAALEGDEEEKFLWVIAKKV